MEAMGTADDAVPRPCRWMAAGPSGRPMAHARGRAAVGCSWPSASAPTLCLPTGAPTARVSASSTAPATWSPARLQVRAKLAKIHDLTSKGAEPKGSLASRACWCL